MVGVLVRVSSQEMMMFVLLRQMIELFDGDDTQLGIYESTLQKLACKWVWLKNLNQKSSSRFETYWESRRFLAVLLIANIDTRHCVSLESNTFFLINVSCIIPMWDVQVKSWQHAVNIQEMCSWYFERVARWSYPKDQRKDAWSNLVYEIRRRIRFAKIKHTPSSC